MTGLAKGYVIPRIKVGKHDGSTVRDGLSGDSAHSTGRVALASDGWLKAVTVVNELEQNMLVFINCVENLVTNSMQIVNTVSH